MLTLVSDADDPIITAGSIRIPAAYARVHIIMAVDGPDNFAQLFFMNSENDGYGDATVMGFEIQGGGEIVTYELDMSTISTWREEIVELRFDPVTTGGTTVRVDEIVVGP